MTTEKAFEKLMNTPCWFALVGITSKQATYIKRDYKNGLVKFNRMSQLLVVAGGVYSCNWICNNGENTYSTTDEAFNSLISKPLWYKPFKFSYQYAYDIKHRFELKTLAITLMIDLLKKSGYKQKESWHLPPEINKAC